MPDIRPLAEYSAMSKDLAEYHGRLRSALMPLTTTERSGRSHPGPRLPVRTDALDAVITLERSAIRWHALLRHNDDTVRRNTSELLLAVADLLLHWPTDQRFDLFIVQEIEVQHLHARLVLDIDERPLSSGLRCPHCNRNIVIWPGQGVIACRNHHCRCSSADCACQHGRGHQWRETEWRMLGLLMEQRRDTQI